MGEPTQEGKEKAREEKGRTQEQGTARPYGKCPGSGEVSVLLGLRDAAQGGTQAIDIGQSDRTFLSLGSGEGGNLPRALR